MTLSWLESIARRAGVAVPVADAVLKKWAIRPDRPVRSIPKLTITRVIFSGEKQGPVAGPFRFAWEDLRPGVWGLGSFRNLRGKSTVLEILLWVLRGEPRELQPDVRSWTHAVEVGLRLGNDEYRISLNVAEGNPSGVVQRQVPSGWDEVDRFTSDDGFAAAMARFMMGSFDLEAIPARQNQAGTPQTVSHGWLAYSGGIYVGGEHKFLLGEISFGGLPGRMLQMFVGMPWAHTVMQTSTAKKEVEDALSAARRQAEDREEGRRAATERLTSELNTARSAIASLPDPAAIGEEIDGLGPRVAELSRKFAEIDKELKRAEDAAASLRGISDEDERTVRSLRETALATRFFNGLNPTCCPRCETAISVERSRQEVANMRCSVCAEPLSIDTIQDLDEQLAEMEDRKQASRAAYDRAAALVEPLRRNARYVESELGMAQRKLTSALHNAGTLSTRRQLELEIAGLERALAERSRPATQTGPSEVETLVISAAQDEAKSRFESAKGSLLTELNAEILRLANLFGMSELEAVALNAQAQMPLQKGGKQTSFTYLTRGERLRLRIATVIALLRVGKNHGIGRHPGLLIIDSPRAEETAEQDLMTALREIRTISEEMPELQVFVATADPDALARALPPENCRLALGENYLW
jgi:hypothetical protein